MSWQATAWVDSLEMDIVGEVAFRVLLKLANVADQHGQNAWRSRSEVAKELGRSIKTVDRASKELEHAALIHRGDQRLVAHLRADRRPIVWDLNLRWRAEFGQPELDGWPRGDTVIHNPHGATSAVLHGATSGVPHRTIHERSTSKRSKRTLAEVDARPAIVRVGICTTGDAHRVRLDGMCADCWQHVGREAS